MNKTKGLLFTASVCLAMAFTISCSGDDGDEGGGGSVTYGGQTYKTVKIGNQVWFAENLNYAGEGNSIGKCYENLESNCAIYGRLYTWATAKTVCPSGWHLPSSAEWAALVDEVGNEDANNAKKLMATTGWSNNKNGTDDYGFTALPGGSYNNLFGSFDGVGTNCIWWTANEVRSYYAYVVGMGNRDFVEWGDFDKLDLNSVRCIKD